MESAARWAREYGATEDYMSYPRHFERITMARVLLGEDRTDGALDSLGNLLEAALSEGRMAHEIELRVLLALASSGLARRARRSTISNARSLWPNRRASCASSSTRGCRWRPRAGDPGAAGRWILRRRTRWRPRIYAGRLLEQFALQAADSGNGGPRSGRAPGLERAGAR